MLREACIGMDVLLVASHIFEASQKRGRVVHCRSWRCLGIGTTPNPAGVSVRHTNWRER